MSADPAAPSGARSLGQAEDQERQRVAAADGGGQSQSSLGAAVQEVTEKASLLVREEIALARAEVTQKATSLGKGAAVAAVAGLIALGGVILLLHTLAWLFVWIYGGSGEVVLGFLTAAVVLLVLAGIAGFVGMKMIKKGTPPKPEMAIEEAQRIRETVKNA